MVMKTLQDYCPKGYKWEIFQFSRCASLDIIKNLNVCDEYCGYGEF